MVSQELEIGKNFKIMGYEVKSTKSEIFHFLIINNNLIGINPRKTENGGFTLPNPSLSSGKVIFKLTRTKLL